MKSPAEPRPFPPLRGSAERRAAGVLDMFSDPEVSLVMLANGGMGAAQAGGTRRPVRDCLPLTGAVGGRDHYRAGARARRRACWPVCQVVPRAGVRWSRARARKARAAGGLVA